MASPIRPLLPSNGRMNLKYRLAMPAIVVAGKDSVPCVVVRTNHETNHFISDGTRSDVGALKWTFSAPIRPKNDLDWLFACAVFCYVDEGTFARGHHPVPAKSISLERGSADDRKRSTIISAILCSARVVPLIGNQTELTLDGR